VLDQHDDVAASLPEAPLLLLDDPATLEALARPGTAIQPTRTASGRSRLTTPAYVILHLRLHRQAQGRGGGPCQPGQLPEAMRAELRLGSGDCMLGVTTVGFDIAGLETFCAPAEMERAWSLFPRLSCSIRRLLRRPSRRTA